MQLRPIKFRAWYKGLRYPLDPTDVADYEKPRMFADVHTLYDGGGFDSPLAGMGSFNSVLDNEDFVIMQFTGIADKNGVEIYEGDILEFDTGIAKVTWDDMAFAVESPGSQAVDYDHSSVWKKTTVIGNIYQNPELFD